jgi:tetratricopeptide (TPR) repeat protein
MLLTCRSMARVLASVVLASALLAQAPARATASDSTEAEYDRLFQELLKSPNDLETMKQFAYLATRLRKYEAAIATFERMLLINANLPAVRLEVGVLYYRLGAYDTAKVYLEGALDDPATTPTAKARARRYLDEVDRRLSNHSLSGAVMAGVRYQTNANAGPSGPFVLSQGFPALLPTAFAGQSDFNGFVSGRLRHRYNFDSPLDEGWVTDAVFYGAKQADLDQYDLGYLGIATGPRLAVLPQHMDGVFFRPFFASDVAFVDEGIYNYAFGGGVNLEKEYDDDARVGVRYVGVYRDFNSPTIFPNDSSDGPEHRVALYAFGRPTDDLSLFGQARFIDNQAEDPQNAYHRYDFFGRVAQYYDPPFGWSWPWQVAVHGWYIHRDYDAPDPAVDPFTTRQDDEYRVGISNNFQVSRDWSIFWLLEYVNVDSNLPNYTYDNVSTLVSAKKRF